MFVVVRLSSSKYVGAADELFRPLTVVSSVLRLRGSHVNYDQMRLRLFWFDIGSSISLLSSINVATLKKKKIRLNHHKLSLIFDITGQIYFIPM